MAGSSARVIALSDGDEAERVPGASITSNLFATLGVRPIRGRDFREDDDRPGAEPVVMLSHEVWQRRYHADPAVVGRIIKVNGKPPTVIGVMPPRFSFPETQKGWIPLGPDAATEKRDSRSLFALGRLKPGVDLSEVGAELASIASTLSSQYPSTNDGWSAMVRPIMEKVLPSRVRLMLTSMMGAVTLVLLVACANVANLMPARRISFRSMKAVGAGMRSSMAAPRPKEKSRPSSSLP